MKRKNEKTVTLLNKDSIPNATINPELNKYQGQILFPEKLAIAEEHLKRINLSEIEKQFNRVEAEKKNEPNKLQANGL